MTIRDSSLIKKDSLGKYVLKISRPIGTQIIDKVYEPIKKKSYIISNKINFATFKKRGKIPLLN